ncbi:MAG TPA: MipA/OmpV family protein [Rhodocyclaceae bacterium]|nr:MipA/OmpV family protein [Rhodocyclaceae bacterium]
MPSSKFLRSVALALAVIATLAAHAEKDQPLWEAGVGVAGFSFPAYRGSDKVHNFLMPVPYFTYHGDFLKADRHGYRAQLFDSDKVDLNLSLSASPPMKSDDVAVRAGMPNLKATVEFGPQLDVKLWRSADQARVLRLRLPMRAAFTAEHSPKSIGWVFSPNLNLDVSDLPGLPDWNFGFLAGPIYADRKQHESFYGVSQQYATVSRPAYAASGGYSGSQFLASVSKRFDKTWFGAFARYDSLSGAAFENSPLVAKRSFATVGFAFSWVLGESSTRVAVDD